VDAPAFDLQSHSLHSDGELSPAAVEIFRNRGIDVDLKPGLTPAALRGIIDGYDGLAIRSSTKVTKAILADTIVIPYNDPDALERVLASGEVAAFIVEPVMENIGICLPDPGYLQAVREITRRHGTMLIFDEVKTGITAGWGGATGVLGVQPDLVTLAKSIGGGLRQAGVVTAAARVSVEDTFLGGKLRACHDRARQISDLWQSYGGNVVNPVETNMVWLDLEAAGISAHDFIAMGEKAGLRFMGGRLVVHYQIGDEAVQRIAKLFDAILKGKELETNGTADIEPEKMAQGVNAARGNDC